MTEATQDILLQELAAKVAHLEREVEHLHRRLDGAVTEIVNLQDEVAA